ncbi:MAG: hypothetical protein RL648_487 [Verrucomicrobiota bacterium]
MKTLPLILFFSCLGLANAQALVDLHVAPDASAKFITRIDPNSPSLGPATPVDDPARAAEGWVSATYSRSLTGYIHSSNMGPDQTPQPGAAIFSFPIENSAPVGTCLQGDAVEILSRGEWLQIRVQRQLVAYYRGSSAPSSATASAKAMAAKDPAREPVREPIVERPITQSFSGVFKQAAPRLGLFTAPLPFVLVDDNGKRVAHVDTSGIVVAGSLQSFLNKPVVIHGQLEKLPDANQWVLRARNIRLR